MDMSKTNEDNNAVEAVANKLRHEVSGISVSTYERSGKAVLRAYVRTREQANSVQRIVNESTTPVFSEIVSLQEVENSAEMMASMKGFAVDVTFAKDGTAYWTGYLPEKSDWKSVLDRLEVDLPFIKDNVCNITFASDIEQRAKELASESGIKASLVFIPRPRELVVSGSLPESLSVSWNGVFAKLKEQFGSIVTLTNDVGTGKTVIVEGNPFHSPISGVTLGAIPSVILLDGQRIYTGSILADGSVLSEISSDQLILTGPSGRRKIPLDLGAGAGGL
jgi:type III secretion system YscD/HrpQ family protein